MAASITTTATTLEGQFIELAGEIQEKELLMPEASRPNRIQIEPDPDALTITITAEIPATFNATGGTISLVAGSYLA
jgi:hypothetical protein